MRRTMRLAIACLLGGLMVAVVTSGLRTDARAEWAHPAPAPSALRATTALTRDVVINEVAWMGTQDSDWDEWIELYNNTANTITLNGWRIAFADGTPTTIALSSAIGPYSYFLLERTEDVVSDIKANQTYGGNRMSNTNEEIILYDDLERG